MRGPQAMIRWHCFLFGTIVFANLCWMDTPAISGTLIKSSESARTIDKREGLISTFQIPTEFDSSKIGLAILCQEISCSGEAEGSVLARTLSIDEDIDSLLSLPRGETSGDSMKTWEDPCTHKTVYANVTDTVKRLLGSGSYTIEFLIRATSPNSLGLGENGPILRLVRKEDLHSTFPDPD